MVVSIFNDVIGPVMRGASSSHCAAALRIGRLARDLMDGEVASVLVEFDRRGSLPTTHESQGSDMGLFGGLLGWEVADDRLPNSPAALAAAGVDARIEIVDVNDPHPNTYRLTLRNARETRTIVAISTGGGMMELTSIDGVPLSIGGDYFETLVFTGANRRDDADGIARIAARAAVDEVLVHAGSAGFCVQVRAQAFLGNTVIDAMRRLSPEIVVKRLAPVLPVLSRRGVQVPFSTCAELLRHDAGRERPLWEWAVEYERARGDLSEAEVLSRMVAIVRVLRRSIAQGVAGTSYDDRMLGHQSGAFDRLLCERRLLDAGVLNRTVLYVTALMEVKSAMGVIVAAPTAGACAALPASCIAVAEEMGLSEEHMAKGMLAAGLIGVFIASQWTFAAEVGGCQAEGGSAAAMAAAALVTHAGGTLSQSMAASSLALQSMLGLICDPVAGRVEAPCLGKNVLAASNALSCANMALANFDPLIPFDEVVDAARRVADRMPREHRCTSLGGLATTKTALDIQARLEGRRAGCGVCS
jgi:L-serine dehydratase